MTDNLDPNADSAGIAASQARLRGPPLQLFSIDALDEPRGALAADPPLDPTDERFWRSWDS